jgi:hypothetical protein
VSPLSHCLQRRFLLRARSLSHLCGGPGSLLITPCLVGAFGCSCCWSLRGLWCSHRGCAVQSRGGEKASGACMVLSWQSSELSSPAL